jgi:phospholipid transport system substrate-binding protein
MTRFLQSAELRTLAVFCLLLLAGLPAVSVADELARPQQVIQEISDQFQQILQRDQEQLENDPAYIYRLANDVLVPYVDFQRVSSLVLGKHWRRAKAEQKTEFSRQFQLLLVRTYSTAFHELREWEIRHVPMRMEAGDTDVTVHTQVLRPGGAPLKVVYRMHQKDGNWLAYDVKIEGISLVTNYRASFSKELRRSGMDGLIQRIAKLNDSRMKKLEVAANGQG